MGNSQCTVCRRCPQFDTSLEPNLLQSRIGYRTALEDAMHKYPGAPMGGVLPLPCGRKAGGSTTLEVEAVTHNSCLETAEATDLVGNGKPGDPSRGLSVHFWNARLMEMLLVASDSELHVYDVEPTIRSLTSDHICPRDGRRGAALVDVAPDPDAGRADIMLSYTWGYRVVDLARSLLAYCRARCSDPRVVRVWACCVCINQHRVKERQGRGEAVPFEDFAGALGTRVRDIGKVVALLSPWSSPLYTQRAWCIYELYVATTTESVEFELFLPSDEATAFGEAFKTEGLRSVWQALARIRVMDSKASVESDRTRILDLVERGPGHAVLDRVVAEFIQAWFLSIADGICMDMLQAPGLDRDRVGRVAEICGEVAELQCEFGKYDAARLLSTRGLAFCSRAGADTSVGSARLRFIYGLSLSKQGSFAAALEQYRGAFKVYEAAGAGRTSGSAECLTLIGAVLREQGDLAGALQDLRRASGIFELAGVGDTPEAAICITAIGRVFQKQGSHQDALDYFRRALRIYEATDVSAQKPKAIAACIGSIGTTLCMQGHYIDAIEHLRQALEIYNTTGRTECSARLLACLGEAFQGQGLTSCALDHYREALEVFEANGAASHPDARATRAAMEALKGPLKSHSAGSST